MAHGLIVRSHYAKAHVAAATPHGEGRDDRVHRTLARTKSIGVILLEREAGSTVGQHDAGLLRADADTKMRIERVDERDRLSIAVDDSKIDRIIAGRGCVRQL